MTGCLIIHGYTGGPHEVEPLATYLREHTDWDIVVPTLPGHGKNLALENIPHEAWIGVAEKSLQQLQMTYDRVYLIGFSMGGMIAAYLAANYEVDRLVLLATAGKYVSFKQMTRDIGTFILDGFRGEGAKNHLYIRFRKQLDYVPFKANLEFLKLIKYTRRHLKNIKSPVFIAQGYQDEIVPARTASYLDRAISSKEKQIVLFERSEHLICWGEDKDTLNKMVYDFLKRTK